jgi:prevent-host-death family protein
MAARDTYVGIRDFRQNLSAHIKRAQEGEVITITEHGRPVAELTKATPGPQDFWDRLIAEGKMTAPTGNWEDRPPIRGEMSTLASEYLREMREDSR